jgi:hypothetical protein
MPILATTLYSQRNGMEEHDTFLLLMLGVASVALGLIQSLGDPGAVEFTEPRSSEPLRRLLR